MKYIYLLCALSLLSTEVVSDYFDYEKPPFYEDDNDRDYVVDDWSLNNVKKAEVSSVKKRKPAPLFPWESTHDSSSYVGKNEVNKNLKEIYYYFKH